MKALAEQISECDGIGDLRPRRRRIRADGRGRRAFAPDVGRRACRDRGRRASLFLARSWDFLVATRCSCPSRHSKVCGADAVRWSPRLPARFAPRPAWLGRVVTRSASRLTPRAPCCLGGRPVRSATGCTSPLEAFLAQGKEEATSLAEGYRRLAEIVAASETER